MALAVALALAASVLAQTRADVSGPFPILAPGVTVAPTLAANGGTYTSDVYKIGKTQFQALQWNVPALSPSINVKVLQSNEENGTYSEWSAPLNGGTVTTNITITTVNGGSSMSWAPSDFVKFQVTNTGSADVAPTLFGWAR